MKPRVFVSYHHGGDQYYYDEFVRVFSDGYDIVTDRSLERAVDSEDPEYVMRRIRESHITGTSCTIVLCGTDTPGRKYVDWEIKATLDKEHGLVGIRLPTCRADLSDAAYIPDRLHSNTQSGYAPFVRWDSLQQAGLFHAAGVPRLQEVIADAKTRSSSLIRNSQPLRARNS